MRGRRFRRSPRPSVSWVDGLTGFSQSGSGANVRTFLLTNTTGPANFRSGVIQLTTGTDLSEHGGEDCVFMGARGRLFLALQDGAGGYLSQPILLTMLLLDINEANNVVSVNTSSSQGLGRDDILWQRTYQGCGFGIGTNTANLNTAFDAPEIRIKAKRKLQKDRQLFLHMASFIAADRTLELGGTLRYLMKRPR